MNTPQVETAEISDADLDNVSGGLALPALDGVTDTVNGIVPVNGTVDTVIGTVQGATGLSLAPVQGLIAGL
jgi:hypothetical protein